MSKSQLHPQMLEIGNVYEIIQDGVAEKYLCVSQNRLYSGDSGIATATELRPVKMGKGILEIRLFSKPIIEKQ